MKPSRQTLIYIAGPYRAKTIHEIRQNIEAARRIHEAVIKLGFSSLCPHLNTAFMDGLVPDEAFLEMGLELLRRCDALLVTTWIYWPKLSKGVLAEVEFCMAQKIPVYREIDEMLMDRPMDRDALNSFVTQSRNRPAE